MPDQGGVYTIKSKHGPSDPMSVAFGKSDDQNPSDPRIDRNLLRPPESWINIFSVARQDVTSQSPVVKAGVRGLPLNSPLGTYVFVTKIPQPFNVPEINLNNNTLYAVGLDARQIAMDYINPSASGTPAGKNILLDQTAIIPQENVHGYGVSLAAKGVFWVEDKDCTFVRETRQVGQTEVEVLIPVPPKEAIIAAERRMEAYYDSLLERARVLELTDMRQLQEDINPDFHTACEFKGLETSWHRKVERLVPCVNCGVPKLVNTKFHINNGIVCVEPTTEAWQSAVNSGVRTLDQIPAKFRSKATTQS